MKIAPVHPFPARMAPEIAISELEMLAKNSVVLDPMMGSGTVLRHAVEFGHKAFGFDTDPLAVLMSNVWSTRVDREAIEAVTKAIFHMLPKLRVSDTRLPWIDEDKETKAFVSFWFGRQQRKNLRKLAYALQELGSSAPPARRRAIDVHRLALSRIIITKSSGASLAADTSHSRPHKVSNSSEFDVFTAFERSIEQVTNKVLLVPKRAQLSAKLGDSRRLTGARSQFADLVLTSPPYLNAIDYMRGHKLSLVWLGYSIPHLRSIRSSNIGAEKKADSTIVEKARKVQIAMVDGKTLEGRQLAMVERYASDLVKMMNQTMRVLKPGGRAILVVGNSCLKKSFVRNSDGVIAAASSAGFLFKGERVRELPTNSRYLPMPKKDDSALGKRMRTESILTFERAA